MDSSSSSSSPKPNHSSNMHEKQVQQQQHENQDSSPISLLENNPKQENKFHQTKFQYNGKHYTILLTFNYIFLFVGSISSTLVSKYYFIHNGSSKWISTWVQSAGFPLLLLPIYLPFYIFKTTQRKPFTGFNSKILLLSLIVGLFMGLNNFLFSLGIFYLPVSTNSLLLSSQLAFNLILSMIIVKQKLTFTNLNCVILLTISSVILGLGSSSDRPKGLTHAKYLLGFFSTVGAGLLFALYLPVMEKIYSKVYCYSMVVEMQLVMETAATLFATVGMAAGGGFSDFNTESRRLFDKGPAGYWATIVGNTITWQLCFMGTAGMVFLTTSLTGGICMTALTAMNVLGGVVVYGDEFGGMKAVSTVLCVWGFCSYLYGMYRAMKMKRLNGEERSCDVNGEDLSFEMRGVLRNV